MRPRRLRAAGGQSRCARGAFLLIATLASLAATNIAAADETPALDTSQPQARTGNDLVLPADRVLAGLIEQSLAARPEVAAAEASLRAQRQRVSLAGRLPDPLLQVGIQNDGFSSIEIGKMETSYVSVMMSQTLPWPGKRGLKTELADLGVQEKREVLARARLATETDVRRAYVDLVLARNRRALLERLTSIWKQAGEVARSRYETGGGAQSDVLRAQLELGRLAQRRLALAADERISLETLNRLRGHGLADSIETEAHVRGLGPLVQLEETVATDRTLSHSPELGAARAGVAATNTAVALAKKNVYPDLVVSAGIMPRGGDFPPMWLLTLGAAVPVYGSRQDAVAESEASTLAAQQGSVEVEQILRLRLRQRRTAFTALLQSIRLYEDVILPESRATAESTLSQYTVGKVSFASVLEANAGYIADEDGYLQAMAEAHRILIADAEMSLDPVGRSATAMSGSGAMPSAGAIPAAARGRASGSAESSSQDDTSSSGM